MRILENRIPPPIVALVVGLAMWGIASSTPTVPAGDSSQLIASSAIALIGAFFCIAGVVSFRLAKTTVNPLKPEKASSLVVSGMYRAGLA
jgi:protein-S-isoprenylcysteine O-methyltransferase Ste14